MIRSLTVRLLPVLAALLFLSSTAYAFVEVPPPYISDCQANFETLSKTDPYHARVDSDAPVGYAEAMIGTASPWDLHSMTYTKLGNSDFLNNASSYAQFNQLFIVTGAGDATIQFHYDGSLSVQDPDNGLVGMYSVSFFVDAYDSLAGDNGFTNGYSLESPGSISYADDFTFTYSFTEDNIGDLIEVTLQLQTGISGEGLTYNGPSYAELSADFFNTAGITGVNGPITPVNAVPVPAAVWLLGSGLTGFFAVRFNKKSQA